MRTSAKYKQIGLYFYERFSLILRYLWMQDYLIIYLYHDLLYFRQLYTGVMLLTMTNFHQSHNGLFL